MGVRRLRKEELATYAQLANWNLADSEVDEYFAMTEAMFDSVDQLDGQPSPPPPRVDAKRDPGRVPTAGEASGAMADAARATVRLGPVVEDAALPSSPANDAVMG